MLCGEGVIARREMALKCKLLAVVITVDRPLPLSSTESMPLRLISAVIAPEESSGHSPSDRAFEQSSACGAVGSRGRLLGLLSYSRAGTRVWPKVL